MATNILIVTENEKIGMKKLQERTEDQISEAVKVLKNWLEKSPHLPSNEDELVLGRLYCLNKFSLQKTKDKLEMYYAAKSVFSEQFDNNYPLHPDMEKSLELSIFVPLPRLTPDYSRVCISRITGPDNDFTLEEFFKCLFTFYEFRLFQDNYLCEHYIFDSVNTSMQHILKMSPTSLIKGFTILQKAYSDRIKGIHLINLPSYAIGIVGVLKKLFKKKMADRVYIHGNLEALYEHIPKNILPEDYGGEEKPIMQLNDTWLKFVKEYNDFLIERTAFKSNEKLRIGKSFDPEVFGLEGSFRTLDID